METLKQTSSTTSSNSAPHAKPDLTKRIIAMIIDSAIAFAVGLIPVIGGIAGAAYLLVRDGLDIDFAKQASVGKQIMKLRPVRLDGQPMDIQTSIRRNWMFGLGALSSVLLYIPILGWALMVLLIPVAFCIGLYEIYNVLTDSEGRRWGDRLAETRVIEVPEGVAAQAF